MAEPIRSGDGEELTAEEQAAQAAFEKKREETRQWIQLLLDQGYRWSAENKNELRHPDDPEMNAWHDPYSEELLISPKLQGQLKEMARQFRPKQAGE
jgi:hypothetical protein